MKLLESFSRSKIEKETAEVAALLNLNRIIFWSQFEPG